MQIQLILALLIVGMAKQDFAYTVRYSKSYNPAKLTGNVGCSEKNMVYGNFIYPQGPVDILYLVLNPHTYNTYLQCGNQKAFAKIFGSGQNYEYLLKADPSTVANGLRGAVHQQHYIIDWKYPQNKDLETSQTWLASFISALTKFNKDIYVKAAASAFCSQEGKYLLNDKINAKFIVEMYGEQPGQYMTYDQIFGDPTKISESTVCKNPSYAFLTKRFPNKDFYIEKTLQKEEAGYLGPKFQKILAKAQPFYNKMVFFDSYSKEIIQL